MDFFQNICFKEHSNMAVTANFWVNLSLYKKECLPIITRNKKHSSKEVVSMIHTLWKGFFATATFPRFVRRFFSDRVKKLVVYFGLCESSLHFQRRETKQIVFMGRKLSFPYIDIQFDVPKGKFILKNNSLESWSCFRLFLWPTQK